MTAIGHAVSTAYFKEANATSARSDDLEFATTQALCHPSQLVYRLWVRTTDMMRNGITRAIVAISVHAATYPWLWISSVLGISAGILGGGLKTNFHMELALQNIFTPTTSKTIAHRAWALDISKFPGHTLDHVPLKMLVHAEGQNVLTYEGVERVFEVWKLATSIRGIEHLCAESEDELEINLATGHTGVCDFYAITSFWDHNQTLFEKEVPVGDDITRFLLNDTYPDGTTVDKDQIFGFLELQENSIPTSAGALFVEIAVPLNGQWRWPTLFDYADQLQTGVAEMRGSWSSSNTAFFVEFVFDFNVAKEFEQTIFSDFPLLPIVFAIMLGFCCCVFWKGDRVRSRLLLALGAVCTVGISLAAGFGLMFLIGIPYTVVTTILPYVIFGVGLDDTFIIYGAFERTDFKKPTVDRIREVFEEVGLSITMTTLTTALAFALGCISTIPAIRDLCLYAWPTVLIDGFFQVSFFVSLIVIDERRIKANRMDCCPCILFSATNAAIASDGSTDSSKSSSSNNNSSRCGKQSKIKSLSVSSKVEKQDARKSSNGKSMHQPWSTQLMGWYADQLLRPNIKKGVILAFTGLFVGCIYSATFLKQDFSFFDLLPSNSPTKTYLSSMERYGGSNGDVFIYFRGKNQSNAAIQDQMIDYIDQIAAIDHVELKPFCFVKDFRALVENPGSFIHGLMQDATAARLLEENPQVLQYLQSLIASSTFDGLTFNQVIDLAFTQPLIKTVYSMHVKREENGDVYASRCTATIKNLDYNSVGDQIALLQAQNRVTINHPLNKNAKEYHAFLYKDRFHLWEFFEVAIQELRYTAVTGIATVTLFSLLFVPHWSGVAYVFPLMCVLYVDLLGLFQAFGLTINVLTYVTLVVSVGLLVDFLMHALLRYYESTKETQDEKVKDMLMTMGASILLGGLSTFLGSLPLIFSQSTVFQTIYIAFFCMISLGVSHGLVLLPVLLSMFGTTETTGQKSSQQQLHLEQDDSMLAINTLTSRASKKDGKEAKVGKEEDDAQTQASSSLSLQSTSSGAPPSHSVLTSPKSLEVPDQETTYFVEQVLQLSSTYDQYEVTIV